MDGDLSGIDGFNYFVVFPEKYRDKSWHVIEDLFMTFDSEDCVILYHHYNLADGIPRSGPLYKPAFVAFKNEEDAVAFKIKWV